MSQLTSTLMGLRVTRTANKWPPMLARITDRLVAEYGTPTLGNFSDPIKEIFYILLSARTNERLYQRAHSRLFTAYPRIELLAAADVADVLECVKGAGLGVKRAKQIIGIATSLSGLGKNAKKRLRSMSAPDAYE